MQCSGIEKEGSSAMATHEGICSSFNGDAPQKSVSPCKRLIYAMIGRAITDITGEWVSSARSRVSLETPCRADAIAWIFEEDANMRPFSFEWCCEQLDLPDGVIAGIHDKVRKYLD